MIEEKDSNITDEKTNDAAEASDGSRRNFLKLGLGGAGAAAAAVTGVTIVKRMEGIPHDEFPLPMGEDYKPIDQRNVILTFAHSKKLNEKHPERIKKFNNFHFHERYKKFLTQPYRKDPGYTQLDRALQVGGFSGVSEQVPDGIDGTDSGVFSCQKKKLFWPLRVRPGSLVPYAAELPDVTGAGTMIQCTIRSRETRN
jgi:hypothetical protein